MTGTTVTPVRDIPSISRREAYTLAAREHERVLHLLNSLDHGDWTRQTDCPRWDVRAMAGHVLGMMEFPCTIREFVHVLRAGRKRAGDRPVIDGMTAVQVADRADLTVQQLIERVAVAGPRAARARYRLPAPLRSLSLREQVRASTETWRLGYLFDVILTRDPWMHRVDINRATGRTPNLTPEHDGRLVADVVAEWARRHGKPFTLKLTGPAGGTFTCGEEGDTITLDAVEFCRILSGRATGQGLLAQPVPF